AARQRGRSARRRSGGHQEIWIHRAGAVRRRPGDQPVQLPPPPGLPQGGAGPGGRQQRHREAGDRHPAQRAQADQNHAGRRRAAGQVCISCQRIRRLKSIYADFLNVLKPKVAALATGNPLEEKTKMGPMVRERDAVRVDEWVREAVGAGARLVTGGERRGAIYAPTVLADVKPDMRVSRSELFGPAVAVTPVGTIDDAIAMSNDTNYGLSAGIFTQNIDWAMKFVQEAESGNLH